MTAVTAAGLAQSNEEHGMTPECLHEMDRRLRRVQRRFRLHAALVRMGLVLGQSHGMPIEHWRALAGCAPTQPVTRRT